MSSDTMKGEVISKAGQVINQFYPKVSVDLSQGWEATGSVQLHQSGSTLPQVVNSGSIVIIQPVKAGWGSAPDKENLIGYTEIPYRQAFLLSYSSLVTTTVAPTTTLAPTTTTSSGPPQPDFYIDGFSLAGIGTQADPIRHVDNNSNEFTSNNLGFTSVENKILITSDPVWFDGITLGIGETLDSPSDITEYTGVGALMFLAYSSFHKAVGEPFSVPKSILLADDTIIT